MTEVVRFERRNAVALITIDRPQQLNALNRAVQSGLWEAFETFERDDTLKAAILTGAGQKAFCAGMDLKEAASSKLEIPPRDRRGIPVIGDNLKVTKPTIAAVNGLAIAGGWLIAQMCDLCVAADHARFAITEAKVGRGVPWAAPLIHMLPQRVAMELLLTGEFISARRLHELGYLNACVPAESLLDTAISLAEKIAANAPLTVKANRELLYLSGEMGVSAALRAADHLFAPVYKSRDAQEGPRSFAEKRAPAWEGR